MVKEAIIKKKDIDQAEPVFSSTKEKFLALIEAYRTANPAKFAAKEAEFAKKLAGFPKTDAEIEAEKISKEENDEETAVKRGRPKKEE